MALNGAIMNNSAAECRTLLRFGIIIVIIIIMYEL